MRWVEVVEVVAVVVAVPAEVPVAGRAEWVVPKLLVPVAAAFAPVVGTASHTWWVSLATRRNVRSAVRRWCVNSERMRTVPGALGAGHHFPEIVWCWER